MNEIIFLVEEAPEGGDTAKALGESLFTEADDLAGLHANVRDAVVCHFDADRRPKMITPAFCPRRSPRGMKLPRDLSGTDLVIALRAFDYEITRQAGSHIRLTAPTRTGEAPSSVSRG